MLAGQAGVGTGVQYVHTPTFDETERWEQADTSMCSWGRAGPCQAVPHALGSTRDAEKSSTNPAETRNVHPALRLVPCSGGPKQPKPLQLPKLGFHDSWKKKDNYPLRWQHRSITRAKPINSQISSSRKWLYTGQTWGEGCVQLSCELHSTCIVLTASSNTNNHQTPAYTKDFVCLISWCPNPKAVKS